MKIALIVELDPSLLIQLTMIGLMLVKIFMML